MCAKILVIGSSNTDMVIKSECLPLPGETVIGGKFEIFAGGKGANQAVAAARAGGDVTMVTAVGDDTFGSQTITNLKKEQINTSLIKIVKGSPSGVALIMVDKMGENLISVTPGANHCLNPEDIKKINFENYLYVVLQMEVPLKTVLYAIQKSKERGCQVILNPAPALKLPDDIFPNIDVLIPNRTELQIMVGENIKSQKSIIESSKLLLKKGVKNIVVTLGSQGVIYINEKGVNKIDAIKVNAIDTVGAGDCFVGCLATALSKGREMLDAIRFACAAAAISVQKPGAQNSLPYLREINQFAEG